MKYLLDSVILIDHFNGISAATNFIANNSNKCVVSTITRAEVLTGFNEDSLEQPTLLLNFFPNIAINTDIADTAAKVRRHFNIKLPDALQASVALVNNLVLVTRNTKDFKGDMGKLNYLIPYKI